jgi:hypothetical protein
MDFQGGEHRGARRINRSLRCRDAPGSEARDAPREIIYKGVEFVIGFA